MLKSISDIEGFTPTIIEIDQTLELCPSSIEEVKLPSSGKIKSTKISELYDTCIFMGGFNSPIEGSADGVNALISSNMYESLKKNDKLFLQFRTYAKEEHQDDLEFLTELTYDSSKVFEENNLFSSYHEGEIMFGPTFKTIPFSDSYDMSKLDSKEMSRSGWTDRIIWTIRPKDKFERNIEFIKQISYDSNNLIKVSQYRPVFSQFKLSF